MAESVDRVLGETLKLGHDLRSLIGPKLSGEPLSYVINRIVTRWTRRHLGMRLTPHRLRHAYGKHTQVSFERTRQIAALLSLSGCK